MEQRAEIKKDRMGDRRPWLGDKILLKFYVDMERRV